MTAAEFIKVRHPQDYDDIPQWHIDELEAYAAQQIADKMVSERLRDAFDAGMEYDRMIHGNCIDGVDFETWYNRLKSRDSHDSES